MRAHLFVIGVVLYAPLAMFPHGRTANQQIKKEESRPSTKKPTEVAEVNNTELQRAQIRQRGIDLIKDAGKSATTLDDRGSAARIQAAAGEALWPYDRITAQNLFRNAFDAALTYYREEKTQDPIAILTRQSSADLCQEILNRLSTRDAALAQQLTDAFNEEKSKKRRAAGGGRSGQTFVSRSHDSDLLNQMDSARLLLKSDQQAAINEVQRISSKGLLPARTIWFLWQLSVQDRAAADHLFLWFLANICYDDNAAAEELLVLVPYLFPSEFLWMPGGTPRDPPKYPRNPASEDLLMQWFIEASVITLSRVASSDLSGYEDAGDRLRWACYFATWLEPRVAQARPQLLTTWHNLIDQLRVRLDPQQQRYLASMPENGKELDSKWRAEARPVDPIALVQQTLEKAEKTTHPAERDQLFQVAALEADRIPDLSWALQIANKIADKEFRQQVEDWVYFNAATRALNKNDLAEVRRYALAIKAPDQSVDLYCSMVRMALKEKDKATAGDLLAEAESQATKADDSPAKVRALVSIGNLWVTMDLAHALETLSSAIETANRVPDYFRDLRRAFHTLGNGAGQRYAFNRGNAAVNLGGALAGFAAVDLDGALDLTRSIKDPSLKHATSIAVGASVLDRTRKEPAESKK